MAEPFETLREVGVAIGGIKEQLGTYAKVFGAVVVLGLGVLGFLYTKIDKVEEGVARNTAILERIEAKMDRVALDTGAIRETVQTARSSPSSNSFPGWVGVAADKSEAVSAVEKVLESEGWIFFPQDQRDD